jgi:glycerate 2-kinase
VTHWLAMRIVVAPDKFAGTLTAWAAAEAIADGWRRGAPGDDLVLRPLADGGPGFLDVLHPVLGGRLLEVTVPDPLGRDTPGAVLLTGDGSAYVESAQACGLHLLAPDERDPKVTTSYGLGVLIRAAVEAGAHTVVIGLGGSATNDGGAGMLAALGVVPRDASGAPLPYGGAALAALDRLDGTPLLRGATLVAATDVDSPLLGLRGASAVYGPQKGATDNDVQVLDTALARLADAMERDLPGCPARIGLQAGGGAAGGIGAALLALGGTRESGIALVRRVTGFDTELAAAGLVVTGEGKYDWQSLRGKVVAGVAAAALDHGLSCVVLAGQVQVGKRESAAAGVEAAYSVAEHAGSVAAAMEDPRAQLIALATRIAKEWSR